MSSSTPTCSGFKLSLVTVLVLFATLTPSQAKKHPPEKLNVIDKCWRPDLNWVNNRERLATCSVGFAGKMVNNVDQERLDMEPRVRHGYAHVANNLYKGWRDYAIGGSMNPSIMSESNLFIAPNCGNKKITWRQDKEITGRSWSFHSVNDIFINGAYASQSTSNEVRLPHYTKGQNFRVANARYVRALTRMSGALRCNERRRC
ncbi:hypothetical protein QQ045_012957 [Rhodiola kirilowii]